MKLVASALAGLSALTAFWSFVSSGDLHEAVKAELKTHADVRAVTSGDATLASQEVCASSRRDA